MKKIMMKIVPRLALVAMALVGMAFSVSGAEAPPQTSRYDVRILGAKGDGVADDTAVFQKALDAMALNGGVLFVPEGDYRITKTLRIPVGQAIRELKFIRIEGSGATSRLLGDGVDYILAAQEAYKEDGSRRYISGVRVNRIAFTSFDADASRSGGIDASFLLRWGCDDSYFSRLNTGIFSQARDEKSDKSTPTWIIRIHHNLFTGCSDYAIKMGRVFDLVIENNTIEHGKGGIAVGEPGDRSDAAANTIRIENNVIEGLTQKPAILGSCWVGGRIAGNYFEANAGGDIELTPAAGDGGLRALTIIANSFQPTKKQRESGTYGPIYLRKVRDTLITGNFSTSVLLHPESGPMGPGVNLVSNTLRISADVGTVEGAVPNAEGELAGALPSGDTENWEVSGPAGRVGLNALEGLRYKPPGEVARSIRYGQAPPTHSETRQEPGSLIFNLNPEVKDGKVLLGWICTVGGSPGEWTPWYGATQ